MKKVVRKILQGCSLTAAMFVFQACYGTEPDLGELNKYVFRMVDENNNAIDGVELQTRWERRNSQGALTSYSGWEYQGTTEADGVVSAYVYDRQFPHTVFLFTDSLSRFEMLDTTFASLSGVDTVEIKLKVKRVLNE